MLVWCWCDLWSYSAPAEPLFCILGIGRPQLDSYLRAAGTWRPAACFAGLPHCCSGSWAGSWSTVSWPLSGGSAAHLWPPRIGRRRGYDLWGQNDKWGHKHMVLALKFFLIMWPFTQKSKIYFFHFSCCAINPSRLFWCRLLSFYR